MRRMMSLVALATAASLGGTALAADTAPGKAADDEASVIEMKVEDGAVAEEKQTEDKPGKDDEATVEMTVEDDEEESKPQESWMTGETPATPQQD